MEPPTCSCSKMPTTLDSFREQISISVLEQHRHSSNIARFRLKLYTSVGTTLVPHGFLFHSEIFFRTTQELEYLFFLSRKARNFQ
jgi:hypothetical protein